MPSNDQLAAMLRSKVGAGSAEDLWALDGLEGEALVIGRQFAELAFLVLDRIPPSARRVVAMVQLLRARDNALEALDGPARRT